MVSMTIKIGNRARQDSVIRYERDFLHNYLRKEIRETIRHTNRPLASAIPFDEMRFAVMDLETTGFHHHKGDEIISIGAVIIEEGQIKKDRFFHEFVDPQCPVPEDVQKLTGIHQDMLEGCPSFWSVLQPFLSFIDGSIVVGHNIEFDMGFINAKLKKYCQTQLTSRTLDTITLARFLGIRSRGFSLDDLLDFYGVESIQRHTALGDALLTAEVFVRLISELKSYSIQTLLGLELAIQYHSQLAEVKF
jgi:DNA polymerase-3 subunit epsilon